MGRAKKHGASRTAEYRTWSDMKSRCGNSSVDAYPYYGARGIRVLYESFEAFLADVGPRPGPGYSIDRIDNDGHYAPGNCRWAPSSVQAKNRRLRILGSLVTKSPESGLRIERAMGGDEVRAIRQAVGLTQAALADKIGVARETVARWETGTRRITEPAARLIGRIAAEKRLSKK